MTKEQPPQHEPITADINVTEEMSYEPPHLHTEATAETQEVLVDRISSIRSSIETSPAFEALPDSMRSMARERMGDALQREIRELIESGIADDAQIDREAINQYLQKLSAESVVVRATEKYGPTIRAAIESSAVFQELPQKSKDSAKNNIDHSIAMRLRAMIEEGVPEEELAQRAVTDLLSTCERQSNIIRVLDEKAPEARAAIESSAEFRSLPEDKQKLAKTRLHRFINLRIHLLLRRGVPESEIVESVRTAFFETIEKEQQALRIIADHQPAIRARIESGPAYRELPEYIKNAADERMDPLIRQHILSLTEKGVPEDEIEDRIVRDYIEQSKEQARTLQIMHERYDAIRFAIETNPVFQALPAQLRSSAQDRMEDAIRDAVSSRIQEGIADDDDIERHVVEDYLEQMNRELRILFKTQ